MGFPKKKQVPPENGDGLSNRRVGRAGVNRLPKIRENRFRCRGRSGAGHPHRLLSPPGGPILVYNEKTHVALLIHRQIEDRDSRHIGESNLWGTIQVETNAESNPARFVEKKEGADPLPDPATRAVALWSRSKPIDSLQAWKSPRRKVQVCPRNLKTPARQGVDSLPSIFVNRDTPRRPPFAFPE